MQSASYIDAFLQYLTSGKKPEEYFRKNFGNLDERILLQAAKQETNDGSERNALGDTQLLRKRRSNEKT